MTNILRQYGREVAEDLFPNYPFDESPIIPEGTPIDFKPVPIPANTLSSPLWSKLSWF
jgi:penicillin amidase